MQRLGGLIEVFDHALLARLVVAPRPDRTNVEGIGFQRLQQRHIVELGVVGERHHAGAAVGPHLQHHVVGHLGAHGHAAQGPAAAVFLARVAHRDCKTAKNGHGRQAFGQWPGTDQQHPELGAEGVDHLRVRGVAIGSGAAGLELRVAIQQRDAALHQAARVELRHQGGQALRIGVEFQQQLQRAATRQAKAVGLVGADAVFHPFRWSLGQAARATWRIGLGEAVNQVVFDAAAGDRSDHRTVFAQSHDGAHRPWR